MINILLRLLITVALLLSGPAWAQLLWHHGNTLNPAGQQLQQLLLPDEPAFAAMSPAERDDWLTREWRAVLQERERFAQYTLPAHWRTEGFDQAIRQQELTTYMAGQAPDYHGYRELQRHYQRLADVTHYTTLPSGPNVRPGERDAIIPVLRQRLAELGRQVPVPVGRADVLDPPLSETLSTLQRAGGLEVTGGLNQATRALINRPPAELRAEIKINLHRWLRLPPATRDYVLINIPSYRLTLVRDGRPQLAMKVIVGRPDWPTPELATHIDALKVNPDWTPTANIMREDLLPAQRRDAGYLDRNGFIAWLPGESAPVLPSSINWQAPPPGLRLVQEPGPHNALGRLKFEMRNRHSVYLHDTPHKSLFGRDRRALSHGCVRLAEPAALASGLGWQVPGHERTQVLPPSQRLPVYMVYFTTWSEGGSLVFAGDIYGKNRAANDA
ncbi:L,D-transpeptidase family protein [Oceanimonas pelagia]|uniref:L,D-transpeptidase family protein n=1 Tax=Oceanimonas pelagia TaxID=3028314 RepID=A0AA50KQQ7_9GAMM|nr:L,D-transpeptidase family protein [Oceanimonas pelagia]WMC11884.1 L,D-transpeptidase family protein [Oceanimonas pelagia]